MAVEHLPSAREANALMRRAMYWRTTSFLDLIKWSTVFYENTKYTVVWNCISCFQVQSVTFYHSFEQNDHTLWAGLTRVADKCQWLICYDNSWWDFKIFKRGTVSSGFFCLFVCFVLWSPILPELPTARYALGYFPTTTFHLTQFVFCLETPHCTFQKLW